MVDTWGCVSGIDVSKDGGGRVPRATARVGVFVQAWPGDCCDLAQVI